MYIGDKSQVKKSKKERKGQADERTNVKAEATVDTRRQHDGTHEKREKGEGRGRTESPST